MAGSVDERVLTAAERERLSAIRDAESLSDLVAITDAASEHEAYFAAKEEWEQLRGKQLAARDPPEGLPGSTVVVDGHTFHIHGITHSNTGAEGRYLREHVRSFLERGDTVYCEQGIRSMYFDGMDGVCEMDDYLWAMDRCAELEGESHVEGVSAEEFDGLAEEVRTLAESRYLLVCREGGAPSWFEKVRMFVSRTPIEAVTLVADSDATEGQVVTATVEETGITQVSLERLFEESDAVSLNCPLTPATRGLVGKEELLRLGPKGYLINTARGELLDECELVNALEDGHLAGAALDVFETEPLPETHPLTSLDNTVLGAHNAGNTSTAIAQTTERTVENLIAGLGEGQPRI